MAVFRAQLPREEHELLCADPLSVHVHDDLEPCFVETGEAEGTVATKGGEPINEDFVYGLNCDYAIEFLSRTESQYVGFCWQENEELSEDGETVIKGKAAAKACQFVTGDAWRQIVMPIRI